jgi:hypothetical protein
MNILMTGATGFIGRTLVQRLQQDGHRVHAWVRDHARARKLLNPQVLASESLTQHLSNPIDVVVNLAGEPIADKRWTPQRKQALRSSRIDLTQTLIEALERNGQQPGAFISGSAIGFYGSQPPDLTLDEDSGFAAGFTHELCADWEQAALQYRAENSRVCLLRTGVVLGKGGGALAKMLPPFKLGLGGPIGDGRQIMSWIHLDDWINACMHLIENQGLAGAFNFTAPEPVSNQQFTAALARAVRRPAIFRVPCKVLELAMGEASELLCQGQKVVPRRLLGSGFEFAHTDIQDAMNAVAGR